MPPDEHLAAVLTAEAAGQQTEFLFFWGHQPQRDGTTGPGCLSQWWPAPFTVDGVAYPTATRPPPTLYHGTVARFLDRIQAQGLITGQRNHVHLSASPDAAAQVGARRGKPIVLAINAAAMHQDGHQFYQAANGIWLTAHVPPEHISLHRHPRRRTTPRRQYART